MSLVQHVLMQGKGREFDTKRGSLPDPRACRPYPATIGLDHCVREGEIEPCPSRVVPHIDDRERMEELTRELWRKSLPAIGDYQGTRAAVVCIWTRMHFSCGENFSALSNKMWTTVDRWPSSPRIRQGMLGVEI
jgi:hypothetical protein